MIANIASLKQFSTFEVGTGTSYRKIFVEMLSDQFKSERPNTHTLDFGSVVKRANEFSSIVK